MDTRRHITPAFAAYIAPARARPAPWRLVFGLGTIMLVYLVANGIPFVAYGYRQGAEAFGLLIAKLAIGSTPATVLIVLATFVPLVLGIFAAVRLWHGRRPATLFGPRASFGRDFWIAAGVIAGLFTLSLALWALTSDSEANLPIGLWLMLLPLSLLAIGGQTLAEELLFRGYLQQQLAARFASPWIWAGLPSAVFGALHYAPATLGDSAGFAAASALIFGLIAADLTARTGNLGAAWGLHFANNAFALAGLGTQGTMTGLALRVTPYSGAEMTAHPVVMLLDLLPYLAAWLILRRMLGAKPVEG